MDGKINNARSLTDAQFHESFFTNTYYFGTRTKKLVVKLRASINFMGLEGLVGISNKLHAIRDFFLYFSFFSVNTGR